MDIVQTIKKDGEALWTKVETLYNDDVAPVLSGAEKEVVALFKPLVTAAEATVLADLKAEATTFLQAAEKGLSLADLETAFLNTLEAVGSELLTVAKDLGSHLLQAFLGLLLSKL